MKKLIKYIKKIKPIKWLIACCGWSGVVILCIIFDISFQTYGKYWCGVSAILLTGFTISLYGKLFRK